MTRDNLLKDVLSKLDRATRVRAHLDGKWKMNEHFLKGEQYIFLNGKGEIESENCQFSYQPKRVFNMIAPCMELRFSKLSRLEPSIIVKSASSDECDVKSASLSSSILSSVLSEQGMEKLLYRATLLSEMYGSSFYKVVWDKSLGNPIGELNGKVVNEGDVSITNVSPFELYPASIKEYDIQLQPYILQVRKVTRKDVENTFGIQVASNFSNAGDKHFDSDYFVELIEYYEKGVNNESGKYIVICGDDILYQGELHPLCENVYYPFIRQSSITSANDFFGTSIIERLIPIQRAYNAVRGRKHEFLNRIAMGVLAVEEGATDIDELCDEGLPPGKVIVYRQGFEPPKMLTLGSVPSSFESEEQLLIKEFARISGVGDFTETGDVYNSITSATGLQLIIEQNQMRLSSSYESIKSALIDIGKYILHSYSKYASEGKLIRTSGDKGEINYHYFKDNDITSYNVILEADNELSLSSGEKRSLMFELIEKGLLNNSDGKMSIGVKNKVLEYIGYGSFVSERDLESLHIDRANRENLQLLNGEMDVHSYDDDTLHIKEHTAFVLSNELDKVQESYFTSHIAMHRERENARAT